MVDSNSLVSMGVYLAVFAVTFGLGVLPLLWLRSDERRAVARLRDLSAQKTDRPEPVTVKNLARTALPRLGEMVTPRADRFKQLREQLTRAGCFGPHALEMFLGAKMALLLLLPGLILVPLLCLATLSIQQCALAGVSASALGLILPEIWLRGQVSQRQRILRQGLPDALDMLVLCMEAGLSLTAAFQRVTGELHLVHPELGVEFNIVQREIQMGVPAGEALRKLGERCGLGEVRDLASVVLQSERFGAGVAKALRGHADTWRHERHEQAQERAQQAAVKILFPTLLCIFPAIFVVLLGPAAFQMAKLFSR